MRSLKQAPVVSVTAIALLLGACGQAGPTDYERELAELERRLAALEPSEPSAGRFLVLVERASLLYRRASMTLDSVHLAEARRAIDRGLERELASEDLQLLSARLALKLHSTDAADEALQWLQHRSTSQPVLSLRSDLALARGRLQLASELARRAVAERPTWDNLARLAHLRSRLDDEPGAEALYQRAQEEITAREMRAFGWVELQRGLLHLRAGRAGRALEHVRRADSIYSGYWLFEKHTAEALAALGRRTEAAALYEELIARTGKPDLMEALGGLYRQTGETKLAQRWQNRALAAYVESVKRGETLYLSQLDSHFSGR